MSGRLDVIRDVESADTIVRIVLPAIEQHTLSAIFDTVPKAVAEQFVKDHYQEIIEKLNLAEVATHIAGAIGQRLAEQMKTVYEDFRKAQVKVPQ